MTPLPIRRRGIILASATSALGILGAKKTAAEGFSLSTHLSTRVVYMQVKLINASTGEVYTRECTGCLLGRDGWVATAAHTFSDPVLSKNKDVIKTLPVAEVAASIGERNLDSLQPLNTPRVVNNRNDFALLQFRDFSTPRDQLLLGRASDVGTGDWVHVSGFMYSDKPRTTKTMKVESKGGEYPFWNLGGDAAPGLSGAPIVNDAGNILGIFSGGDRRPGGGNYGIPINHFHDELALAEPIYANGLSWVKGTGTEIAGRFEKTFPIEFRAPPAQEEDVIQRPFSKTYLVPPNCEIVSASLYVNNSKGVVDNPQVTVDARNVTVACSIQSGPRSTGKAGSIHATLTMELIKKS